MTPLLNKHHILTWIMVFHILFQCTVHKRTQVYKDCTIRQQSFIYGHITVFNLWISWTPERIQMNQVLEVSHTRREKWDFGLVFPCLPSELSFIPGNAEQRHCHSNGGINKLLGSSDTITSKGSLRQLREAMTHFRDPGSPLQQRRLFSNIHAVPDGEGIQLT